MDKNALWRLVMLKKESQVVNDLTSSQKIEPFQFMTKKTKVDSPLSDESGASA